MWAWRTDRSYRARVSISPVDAVDPIHAIPAVTSCWSSATTWTPLAALASFSCLAGLTGRADVRFNVEVAKLAPEHFDVFGEHAAVAVGLLEIGSQREERCDGRADQDGNNYNTEE